MELNRLLRHPRTYTIFMTLAYLLLLALADTVVRSRTFKQLEDSKNTQALQYNLAIVSSLSGNIIIA